MKHRILILLVLIASFAHGQNGPTYAKNGLVVGDPSGTSADPGGVKAGYIYWNSTLLKFRKYDGTSWSDLVTAVGPFGFSDIGDESFIPSSYIATNEKLFGHIEGIDNYLSALPVISDVTYHSSWDGDLNGPTKNAIYDKIESMVTGDETTLQIALDNDNIATGANASITLITDTEKFFHGRKSSTGGDDYAELGVDASAGTYLDLTNNGKLNRLLSASVNSLGVAFPKNTVGASKRYMGIGATDGSTTVYTNDEGIINISSLLSSGSVTSVAVSGSDGIEIDSGNPITTSGTIALGLNKVNTLSFLNVEDGADVTDATNVEAAGAVMTTGAQNVAGVKTFEDNLIGESNITAGYALQGQVSELTLDASPTVAPEQSFKGYRQSWRMGIDVANNGGGGDFVMLASDTFGGGVRDLIYVSRNKEGDNSITDDSGVPTLGFFMTPPYEGVQTMAATVEDKPNRTTFGIRRAAATTDNFMLGFFGSEDEVADYGVKNTFEHSPFLKVRGELSVLSSDIDNTPYLRLNANPSDASNDFVMKNYYSGGTGYEFRMASANGSNVFYKYNPFYDTSTFDHNVISTDFIDSNGTTSTTGTSLVCDNNITGTIYNYTTPSTSDTFTVTGLKAGAYIENYVDTTGDVAFPTATCSGSETQRSGAVFKADEVFKMVIYSPNGIDIDYWFIPYSL